MEKGACGRVFDAEAADHLGNRENCGFAGFATGTHNVYLLDCEFVAKGNRLPDGLKVVD